MVDFEKEIKAYALKNAIEHGKADASKILPKLFQHGLKKEEIGKIMPFINKVVKDANELSKEQRVEAYKKLEGVVKEREERKKGLAELPNVGKKVVLRIAPFPSGALHLGNAKTFLLNSLYAEKYKGKLILVMDDTIGSEKKPLEKESYGLIKEGLKYLGIEYDKKIIYKSDRLNIYYKYAEKLIRKDKAYVCYCTQEELKGNRSNGKDCGCRILPRDVQLLRWKEMFKMDEGHAILRIKTSMIHPNPAFRDRVLFKISDREHVKVGKKYRVWPTLEMSWAIDDHLLGITHIIRGNDLLIESDMERYIWDIFGWKYPEIIHTGFVKIEGANISKSKSKKEVESGEFSGWDDPRTWSIQSLKRRGITKGAIKEFVEDIGLNKQDITVPIENLYSINRKILDAEADRYSFVKNPVKLKVKGGPKWDEIEVPVHPDKDEKRKVKLGKNIFVSEEDFKKFRGKEIRLLHLFNVNLDSESEVTSIDNKNIAKINWVGDFVIARVLMPEGAWVEGLVDSSIKKLKKGELVQFERNGFVRFEKTKTLKGKKVFDFVFSHG